MPVILRERSLYMNNNKKQASKILLTPELVSQIEAAVQPTKSISSIALLKSVYSFLMTFCPKDEQDLEHLETLIKAAELSYGNKSLKSDYEKIIGQVELINKNSKAVQYCHMFRLMTQGQIGQLSVNYTVGVLLMAIAQVKGNNNIDVKEEQEIISVNSLIKESPLPSSEIEWNITQWMYGKGKSCSPTPLNKWIGKNDDNDFFF